MFSGYTQHALMAMKHIHCLCHCHYLGISDCSAKTYIKILIALGRQMVRQTDRHKNKQTLLEIYICTYLKIFQSDFSHGEILELFSLRLNLAGVRINQYIFNTLRPRQNGRHFADDIFKCIFLNENVSIAIKISLKFVPKGPISNIPSLVQIMAWRRPGNKPLSEPMMARLHICVTRPQWVKIHFVFTYAWSTMYKITAFDRKLKSATLRVFMID